MRETTTRARRIRVPGAALAIGAALAVADLSREALDLEAR